MKFILKSISY